MARCHIAASAFMDTRRYRNKRVVKRPIKDWLNKYIKGRWSVYIDKKVTDPLYPNIVTWNYYLVFDKNADLILFKLTWG